VPLSGLDNLYSIGGDELRRATAKKNVARKLLKELMIETDMTIDNLVAAIETVRIK
jgi:hypothetical protein